MKNTPDDILFHSNTCHFYQQDICRSCEYMGGSIADSIELKMKELKKYFPGANILDFETLETYRGTRQKAKLAAFLENGRIQFGIYQLDKKVNLEECPLYSKELQKIITKIKDFLILANVEPYDLKTKKGELKFLIINEALWTNYSTYMVRIVLRSREAVDRIRKKSIDLIKANPEIQVLSCNIQPLHAAILEGEEELIMSENSFFEMPLLDKTYFLGVKSFSQVNQLIAQKLYLYVQNFIRENRIKSMIELYCGVGGFSLASEDFLERSVGVEVSEGAIGAAMETLKKRKNSLSRFVAMKTCDYLKSQQEKFELILVNPPRNGLDKDSIEIIKRSDHQYFIYSSCQPETLLRDMKIFESVFQLVSLKPFDMFIKTKHMEVVAIFKRRA